MSYKEMTKEELQEIRKEVAAKYDELKAKGLIHLPTTIL